MGEIFDRAAALDRGVAKRWKERTRESLSHEITAADVMHIVGPLFKGRRKLTASEGRALVVIFEPATFTEEGTERLRQFIDDASNSEQLWRKQLKGDALAPVHEALSNKVVSQIIFKSPGTHIRYAPYDYHAVSRLIEQGRIKVFRYNAGGISRASLTKAVYDPLPNEVVLKEFEVSDAADHKIFLTIIVHEVTHAIQDWTDVRSLVHDEEADAFIAQTVAGRVLGRTQSSAQASAAVHTAAKHVIAKTATDGNKDWLAAYKAVVGEMAEKYKRNGDRSWNGREKVKERDVFGLTRSLAALMGDSWQQIKKSNDEMTRALAGVDLGKYAGKR